MTADLESKLINAKDEFVELESGLLVPHWAVPKRLPTCVDLFCGCGGMSVGMIQAGFEVVAAVEQEHVAAHTYLVNLGAYPCEIYGIEPGDREGFSDYLDKSLAKEAKEAKKRGVIHQFDICGSGYLSHHPDKPGVKHFFIGDIRKLIGKTILDAVGLGVGDLDCVVGGPPCQGFSLANSKRSNMDPRNSLVFEFIRLVIEMMPKTMCMENVPQMAKMYTPWGTSVIDEIVLRLEGGGWAAADALKRVLLGDSKAKVAIRRQAPSSSKKAPKSKRCGKSQKGK